MAIRTVRMNAEEDALLQRIKEMSGLTASEAIKRGLRILEAELMSAAEAVPSAYEIYESLDLGSGGDAVGPARDSRRVASDAIRKRAAR